MATATLVNIPLITLPTMRGMISSWADYSLPDKFYVLFDVGMNGFGYRAGVRGVLVHLFFLFGIVPGRHGNADVDLTDPAGLREHHLCHFGPGPVNGGEGFPPCHD